MFSSPSARLLQGFSTRVEEALQTGVFDLAGAAALAGALGFTSAAQPWPAADVVAALGRLSLRPDLAPKEIFLCPGPPSCAGCSCAAPGAPVHLVVLGGPAEVAGIASALLICAVASLRAASLHGDDWLSANSTTQGALQSLVAKPFCPEVRIHPDLSYHAQHALGRAQGRALVGALAEAGLAARPWHLWLGPRAPVDLCSPYIRDLGPALWQWRTDTQPFKRFADAQVQGSNALYAIADAFVASDPLLAAERAQAERTVGIVHTNVFGLDVHFIDLGRCQPALWDERLLQRNRFLRGGTAQELAPIVVQLPYPSPGQDERALGALVARMGQSLGTHLRSLSVLLPGELPQNRGDAAALGGLTRMGPGGPNLPLTPATMDSAPHQIQPLWANSWPLPLDAAPTWAQPQQAEVDEDQASLARANINGGAHLIDQLIDLKNSGTFLPSGLMDVHVYRPHSQGADALALRLMQSVLSGPSATPKRPTNAAGLRV